MQPLITGTSDKEGFTPCFGDITFWNILASCVVLPHISSYL
jgi:hypothetical protein